MTFLLLSVHDTLITTFSQETFISDILEILKNSHQNF